MKKISVIYWSGTGNTKAMAEEVAKGANIDETEVNLLNVGEATIEDVKNADAVAFGCPAMGAEELEDTEMEPFIDDVKDELKGKNIVLFGSYGWGTGEWMTEWEERMEGYGANVVKDSVIANEYPSDENLEECEELGKALA